MTKKKIVRTADRRYAVIYLEETPKMLFTTHRFRINVLSRLLFGRIIATWYSNDIQAATTSAKSWTPKKN